MDGYAESNFDPSDFYSTAQSRFIDTPTNNQIPFTLIGNDKFFQALYAYHQSCGLVCVILKQICYLLTVLFSILFSGFLTTCVDWKSIHDGSSHDLFKSLYPSCRPPEGRNGIVMFFFWTFMIWFVWQLYRSTIFVSRMTQVRHVWTQVLKLSDDVNWVTWEQVVESFQQTIDPSGDVQYIANRIMRYDNFLIGMLTKDVFGIENTPFSRAFSKLLEWNLKYAMKRVLFKHDDSVNPEVLQRAHKDRFEKALQKGFIILGIMNLIFMPFMLCAIVVFFIYRHVGEFNRNPKALGYYTFTHLARWKLRDFNELPHAYTNRLNKAHPKVVEYLDQFGNEKARILSNFFAYVITSTFFILMIISYFNADIVVSLFMLERPIIFYVGLFGAAAMMLPDNSSLDVTVHEPDRIFDELVETLHHTVPTTWKDMTSRERYDELSKLFRYKWLVVLEEGLSILTVPYVLIFKMPKRAKNIVDFFRENGLDVDKLGIVCRCADFTHGITTYETVDDTVMLYHKMEASYAQFQHTNPHWASRISNSSQLRPAALQSRQPQPSRISVNPNLTLSDLPPLHISPQNSNGSGQTETDSITITMPPHMRPNDNISQFNTPQSWASQHLFRAAEDMIYNHNQEDDDTSSETSDMYNEPLQESDSSTHLFMQPSLSSSPASHFMEVNETSPPFAEEIFRAETSDED